MHACIVQLRFKQFDTNKLTRISWILALQNDFLRAFSFSSEIKWDKWDKRSSMLKFWIWEKIPEFVKIEIKHTLNSIYSIHLHWSCSYKIGVQQFLCRVAWIEYFFKCILIRWFQSYFKTAHLNCFWYLASDDTQIHVNWIKLKFKKHFIVI